MLFMLFAFRYTNTAAVNQLIDIVLSVFYIIVRKIIIDAIQNMTGFFILPFFHKVFCFFYFAVFSFA